MIYDDTEEKDGLVGLGLGLGAAEKGKNVWINLGERAEHELMILG
jgi:hypothetical protein